MFLKRAMSSSARMYTGSSKRLVLRRKMHVHQVPHLKGIYKATAFYCRIHSSFSRRLAIVLNGRVFM